MSFNRRHEDESEESYAARIQAIKDRSDSRIAKEREQQSEPITIESIRAKMNPSLTGLGAADFCMTEGWEPQED